MAEVDEAPPDAEMIRRAEQLVTRFRASVRQIHDKVFEHYQETNGGDGWLGFGGSSGGLSRAEILEHLEARTLTVARDGDEDDPYSCRVYIIPDWDEEHAIYLDYQEGEWEFVEA